MGHHVWLLLSTITVFSGLCSEIRHVSLSSDYDTCSSLNVTCHELSFYINQTKRYFTDDSIFLFTEGTHLLHHTVIIDGVSNLTLTGLGYLELGFQDNVMQTTVILSCSSNKEKTGGLLFINVTDLKLVGLTITGCSFTPSNILPTEQSLYAFYSYLRDFDTFVYDSSNFVSSVFMIEVRNMMFSNMSIQNATNFGLVAVNVLNSMIVSSSFSVNNIKAFEQFEECSTVRNYSCSGGNVLILFTYSWVFSCDAIPTNFFFNINQANFTNGFGNTRYDHFNSMGGGISVFMDQSDYYRVDVTMDQVVSYNNTGQLCGNINFLTSMGTKFFRFSLTNSISSYGNQRLKSTASSGGGLQISLGVPSEHQPHNCVKDNRLSTSNTSIYIAHTNFSYNTARYGGALNIFVNKTFAEIYMSSCLMERNYGWRGISMYINQNNFDTILKYVFENVTVRQSIYLGSIQSSEDYKSSISLFRMENFKFVNLVVEDNFPNFGAYLYYSQIHFGGTGNRFSNCSSAGSGGGMHLSALSSIVFEPDAVIYFEKNHANRHGGAIYADTNQLLSPLCFININDPPPVIVFINNTAVGEGDAVYIGQCSRLQNDERTNKATKLLDTFDFNQQHGLKPVVSAPFSVSYCTNGSVEMAVRKNITAHPGETVQLSIATLGIRNTASSGLIKIDILTSDNIHTNFQYSESSSTCFDVSYTVMNIPGINNLSLKVSTNQEQFTSTGFSLQKSIRAYVDILVCPTGFELFNDECVCNRLLQRIVGNVTTDISTHMFTRQGNVWFGYDNNTDSLLVDTNCPFDYCRRKTVSFLIHNPDDQCDLNRSGKVCGECAKGLSLMLGSNICGICSDLWLLLIIPSSIVAGIALVALLINLNLTVSIGTVNGLIFFANVIKLNEFAFFTHGSVPVLSQFISWVNLDFGITCCFYNGFDAVAKIWIQFLFPIYIFSIIIFIIIICKFSTKAAKLFGHNAVQVFATLILLSYTKLFRLIVPIIQFKYITSITNDSTTTNKIVWSINPNIPYTSFSHLPLVFFAVLVLVSLVIPYTVILIFQPVMLKLQISCFQKLCLNFKPLFDAYYGPFKTRSKIFPGILLCSRLILVIVASLSTSSQIYLSCTITIVVVLLALMIAFQGIYTETYLNILESSFLLTLAIMAIFVERALFVSIIGACVALVMFCGILVLHICRKPSVLSVLQQIKKAQRMDVNNENEAILSSEVNSSRWETVTSSSIELHREPMIFSDEYKDYDSYKF